MTGLLDILRDLDRVPDGVLNPFGRGQSYPPLVVSKVGTDVDLPLGLGRDPILHRRCPPIDRSLGQKLLESHDRPVDLDPLTGCQRDLRLLVSCSHGDVYPSFPLSSTVSTDSSAIAPWSEAIAVDESSSMASI